MSKITREKNLSIRFNNCQEIKIVVRPLLFKSSDWLNMIYIDDLFMEQAKEVYVLFKNI